MPPRIDTPAEIAAQDYLRSIAQRLTVAGHGGKGPLIREAMQHLNTSRADIYRRLDDIGYITERKTRTDKGKSCVDADTARLIGGMLQVATRANGKRILAIKDATELLQEQGLAPNVSAATISRALRTHFVHPQQLAAPSAHTRQRSLHPNHVWQIDASVCVLFYLPKGGLQVMEEKEFYKNKPQNLRKIENQRAIRYVVTDHYSGAIYVEYVTGSENANNLINVFLNAIQRRSTKEPFSGVPHILIMDKGSANTAGMFSNLLDRLGVRAIAHATGNSRAKGSVEKAQDIVECKFESRLSFITVTGLEHLNQLAQEWRQMFNERAIHSRTKLTRNQVWQTIKSDQLRIAPPLELCRELVTTVPTTVTVKGDLSITYSIKGYGSLPYDVRSVPGVYVKAKLDVCVNPYRAPSIDVLALDGRGQPVTITLEPKQIDWVGFSEGTPVIGDTIRSVPDSVIDQQRKRINQAAYGVDTEALVDAARKRKDAAYVGKIDAMADVKATTVPDYLPRAGEQVQTNQTPRAAIIVSHVEAARQIKGHIGEHWQPAMYGQLVKDFPGGVPEESITHIVEGLRAAQQPEPKRSLRVING